VNTRQDQKLVAAVDAALADEVRTLNGYRQGYQTLKTKIADGDTMDMEELEPTWSHALRVWWLIFWREILGALLLGLLFGIVIFVLLQQEYSNGPTNPQATYSWLS
jgi:hypothetical protein